MRKLIAIIIVAVFLVVPTAVVTAGQNWDEISKTLGEISKSLTNISTLIGQGALVDEDVEEMSLSQLVIKSGIPVGLMTALENMPELKSARFNAESDFEMTVTTDRKSAEMSGELSVVGAFDTENDSASTEVSISTEADRDFAELLYGEDAGAMFDSVTDMGFGFSLVSVGGESFFRLEEGGDFGLFDLSDYRKIWLSFSGEEEIEGPEDIGDGLDDARDIWQNKERREEEIKAFLQAYIKYPIFEFTKLSDTRIDGKWYTSYRINLVTKNLISFNEAYQVAAGRSYNPLSSEERNEAEKLLSGLEVVSTVSYDSEIKKITSDIKLEADEFGADHNYNEDLEKQVLEAEVEVNFFDFNSNISFSKPSKSTPFAEVAEDILGKVFGGLFGSEDSPTIIGEKD